VFVRFVSGYRFSDTAIRNGIRCPFRDGVHAPSQSDRLKAQFISQNFRQAGRHALIGIYPTPRVAMAVAAARI